MTIDMIAAATTARIDKSYASDTPAARPAARAATATDTVTQQQKSGEPSRDQLNKAVSELNQSPRIKTQNLQFSIDEDSKRTVVKVIDQETKEVLRQIPTKEALEIAKSFEMAKGQLIDQSA
ncbi:MULTISPECIES: flagellar protein FlaG [unclassified Janthinobacterium]|uniref:flagellar protein FlaG n=1 Tax=unclassified Janthinobacterium TaxID=2610881 RepID=UPI001609FEE5|nr:MULTISPECIES: flagellar protein FlaG [unclassified Janthinobacterium]MBB5367462.1 flagellar protein FlaG [Janthinobacterium sp. K2C7]MBB5380060.1 flagellar protein FlaG [Janthinobacterium sp. K2Li3]MBB5385844.1 flagellar protein FlaG [Janthinobacterium sp. K2E3]